MRRSSNSSRVAVDRVCPVCGHFAIMPESRRCYGCRVDLVVLSGPAIREDRAGRWFWRLSGDWQPCDGEAQGRSILARYTPHKPVIFDG